MKKFMEKFVMVLAVVAMGVSIGCRTTVRATSEKRPDFTRSEVKITGSGDKLSEIVGSGIAVDGSHDDPNAVIQSINSKQESSGADVIIGSVMGPLVTLLTGVIDMQMKQALRNVQNYGGTGTQATQDGDYYSFAGSTTGSSNNAIIAGYDAVPGEGGVGVYGYHTCSRCQAYVREHGSIIDYWKYRDVALQALKDRGFSGGPVSCPLLITEDSYQMMAK